VLSEAIVGGRGMTADHLGRRGGGSGRLPTGPLLVRRSVEFLAAATFAVSVYEVVVAGALAQWPDLTDSWILLLWMTSATVAGLGMSHVRRAVGSALRRAWPATAGQSDAFLAMAAVGGAVATSPERACTDVAALVAAGTGARAVRVWLAEPEGGLRCASGWPDGPVPGTPTPVAPTPAALGGLPGADHVASVTDGDGLLGALVLTTRPRRGTTTAQRHQTAAAAAAVAPLLRNLRLTGEVEAALAHEQEQERELARSRHRVIVARDIARARLSEEIHGRVAGMLAACAEDVDTLIAGSAPDGSTRPADTILATMTQRIDEAISDFRQIVHGFYPSVLTDHGLASSLDNLVAALPWTASCEAAGLPRFDRRVEMGVYFCLATIIGSLHAMRTAADQECPIRETNLQVALDLDTSPPVLSATVVVHSNPSWSFGRDTVDPDILDAIDDRVGALDGRLDIARDPVGVRIDLSVPVPSGTPGDDEPAAAVIADTATGQRP
jgi:signal transduction histidine kinase